MVPAKQKNVSISVDRPLYGVCESLDMVCESKPENKTLKVKEDDLREWAAQGKPFAVATCYDATIARWLRRGGIRVFVVGDSAAQLVLGFEPGRSASIDFMAAITGAVRRGAPDAFVIGDLPRDTTDCGSEMTLSHARRMIDEGADAVKIEVNNTNAALVNALVQNGIHVVAHVQHRSDGVRCTGKSGVAKSLDGCAQARLVEICIDAIQAGSTILLLESLSRDASNRIVPQLRCVSTKLVVLGCDAGPICDGQVRVLHDLLGISDTVCSKPGTPSLGQQIEVIAANWVKSVHEGNTNRR